MQLLVLDAYGVELEMLMVGRGITTVQTRAASSGAEGRSPTAAGDGADNRANSSTCADLLSRVLAAGSSLTAVLIGLDGVVLVADFHPIKLQREQRLPGELPGTFHVHDMAFDVIACRNRDVALNRQWRIQRGVESLAGLAALGVNRIDKPNRHGCAGRDRHLLRRRRTCRRRRRQIDWRRRGR